MAKLKRAVVIGCGGALGGAWAAAALRSAENRLGWDLRNADVIIGTSAGAVLGTLLSAGVSVDEIAHWQGGHSKSVFTQDAASVPSLPPRPKAALTAPGLISGLLQRKVSLMTALSGMLPVGTADMQGFVDLIDAVVPPGQWTRHPATWLMVVDAANGQRVALGYPGSPSIAMNKAVCASYAVPGWCPPVEHNGRTYIDGGAASPTSADLLISTDVSEAIVIAPMASTDMGMPRNPAEAAERLLRKQMTRIVEKEIRQLEHAGIRVRKMYPVRDDLAAMGYNLMDRSKRRDVYETALRTTGETVSRWRA
jgi:NTE family protein